MSKSEQISQNDGNCVSEDNSSRVKRENTHVERCMYWSSSFGKTFIDRRTRCREIEIDTFNIIYCIDKVKVAFCCEKKKKVEQGKEKKFLCK